MRYAASQKGDNALAAKLARILQRTWDKAEDCDGDTALSKNNRVAFEDIDKAMHQFVEPLEKHASSAPDPAARMHLTRIWTNRNERINFVQKKDARFSTVL